VIMTATAMIIGMLPMALGLGEGGEQNAPLGARSSAVSCSPPSRRYFLCRSGIQLLHRQPADTAKAEPKENVPSTALEEPVSAT
jgi:Cation/multidrug efflux pump